MIKDSGERREFETGAVRDIQEGKGRCDLMPLDIIADLFDITIDQDIERLTSDQVLTLIDVFKVTGRTKALAEAIVYFSNAEFGSVANAMLQLAIHFEDGAKKYGENNWQKGIPVHCYIDSAVRHYLKFVRGDADEPHERAFIWNLVCCMWTMKYCPNLDDYTWRDRVTQ